MNKAILLIGLLMTSYVHAYGAFKSTDVFTMVQKNNIERWAAIERMERAEQNAIAKKYRRK